MGIKSIAGFAIGMILAAAAAAQSGPLADDHPQRYTVQRGDTLWDIADRFLKDPWLWPEVWQVNPQIDNPHLIYPGDVIKLTFVDGEPRLTMERGLRTVRLSPEVRAEKLDEAIPTIPLDAIRPFLTRPQVVSDETLENAAYIVQSAGEHIIAGPGDRVYVRGLDTSDSAGTYSTFRPGDTYRDPDTGEVLGHEAVYVASASLVSGGDPATLQLTQGTREARVGDRVMPVGREEYKQHFTPRAPQGDIDGHIISVVDGVSQIGQYQIVVLDRGHSDGLEAGHVLAVYRAGEEIRDTVSEKPDDTVQLPDQRAGEVMVFRTFDRVSYALVMDATQAIHVMDAVRSP